MLWDLLFDVWEFVEVRCVFSVMYCMEPSKQEVKTDELWTVWNLAKTCHTWKIINYI